MKNALICLEQLNVGGVETFSVTQIEEFSKRGINCVVLAKKGKLCEKIEKIKNVKIIDFEYTLQNYIDFDKVKVIENVIIENNIDFIYVHQFPCVLYILPAVFKTKTPYIAYLHSIIPKTCEWFMDTYDVYKILFPIYFEYASKIIAITNNVMKENKLLFDQPKNKYMIINNSIDFSKFPDVKVTSLNYPYNRFLLFGRISKEKQDSIETAIKYYRYCK